MSDDRIYLNGIDGVTGQYLVPPLSAAEAVAAARDRPPEKGLAGWLERIRGVLLRPFLGLPLDVNPTDVSRAGWGVVFARGATEEVRSALEPLVAHRRRRVPPDRCKVLEYRPGELLKDWLKRHGVALGSVTPTKVPYYVLLVGTPDAIPFEFQYLLDIEYAVGRMAFDRPDQYRQYAESVVHYENATAVPNAREVVYWGTRHLADRATQMSADGLITPLHQGLPAAAGQESESPIAADLGYTSRCLKARDATKASLAQVLHGAGRSAPPAFLFTASHGMGWPMGHERQAPAQGALLCQDWSGFGSMRPEHYLAAADVADDALVHGMVAFHFACYGAGTPSFDPFLIDDQTRRPDRSRGPRSIAERPFVAALPQRLLAHPNGAALAVLGHVERAWGYSIRPQGLGPQLVPFRNLLHRILGGEPVGHATKDFSEKYAALSADLLDQLDEARPGPRPTDEALAWTWVERNDARSYVVLGDPAVRLRVDLLAASGRPDVAIVPMTAAATPTPVVLKAALQEAGCGPVPEQAGDGSLAPALATPEPFAAGGWYDDLPVVGKLPPEQAAIKLRDIVEDGTAEVEQFAEASESFALTGWPWSNQARPWQHTAHVFGYIAPAPPGEAILLIRHAGNMTADSSLKGARIKITLDRLRVAAYPGGGMHRVLFDFYAQNQVSGGEEHLHFNTTYRVREGEQAAVLGFPIFVGLGVGTEVVAFRCYTVNLKNEQDESLLSFLDADVFKAGLRLATTLQPALAPLSATAVGLTRAIAARSRNVPVQDFFLGLDFSAIPTRARLAEGSFLAVQVPEAELVTWNWGDWAYSPASGQIVRKDEAKQVIPYNYVVFSISRFEAAEAVQA